MAVKLYTAYIFYKDGKVMKFNNVSNYKTLMYNMQSQYSNKHGHVKYCNLYAGGVFEKREYYNKE